MYNFNIQNLFHWQSVAKASSYIVLNIIVHVTDLADTSLHYEIKRL